MPGVARGVRWRADDRPEGAWVRSPRRLRHHMAAPFAAPLATVSGTRTVWGSLSRIWRLPEGAGFTWGVTGCPRCLASKYHGVGVLTEGTSGLLCRKRALAAASGLAWSWGVERCCREITQHGAPHQPERVRTLETYLISLRNNSRLRFLYLSVKSNEYL